MDLFLCSILFPGLVICFHIDPFNRSQVTNVKVLYRFIVFGGSPAVTPDPAFRDPVPIKYLILKELRSMQGANVSETQLISSKIRFLP